MKLSKLEGVFAEILGLEFVSRVREDESLDMHHGEEANGINLNEPVIWWANRAIVADKEERIDVARILSLAHPLHLRMKAVRSLRKGSTMSRRTMAQRERDTGTFYERKGAIG